MHGYKILHVGDLTENVKFLEKKLVMHYAMHGDKKFVCDDFNEHDNSKGVTYLFYHLGSKDQRNFCLVPNVAVDAAGFEMRLRRF